MRPALAPRIVVGDVVMIGVSGAEFGVRCFFTGYDINTGKRLWRGYSMGPDEDILFNPEKTMSLGKPVGKDCSLKTWNWRPVEAGRRFDLGLVRLGSQAEPCVLRHGQPVDVEPGSARWTRWQADRPEVVDVHHRS